MTQEVLDPVPSPVRDLVGRIEGIEAAIEDLFSCVTFGSHRVGQDGLFAGINDVELAWLGQAREELLGKCSFQDLLTPHSRQVLGREYRRCGAQGFRHLELELLRPDQSVRAVALSCFPSGAGAAPGMPAHRALLFDLTELKRSQEQQRMEALSFESSTGICITDAQGRIVRVNRAFSELTGYEAAELLGQTMDALSSGRRSRAFYEMLWADVRLRGRWQGEVHDRRKDGSTFTGWLSISAVAHRQGRASNYVANLYDISAYRASQDEIRHMAFFDALTELPNRRLLEDRLSRALAATARSGRLGAILFVDLDHFKVLNDTRGHAAGDQLLVEVARRLRLAVRDDDTVARLGGDEFVVLLGELASDTQGALRQAGQVATKMLLALAAPVHFDGFQHATSASIGVALITGQETVSALLQHSDLAMYEAKRAGRNTVRYFEPALLAAASGDAEQAQALWRAVEQRQFELFYQPQWDAARRIVSAEALLRWRHPTRGLLAPGAFMDAAESSGLIVGIGRWVLETACRQIAAWAEPGPCAGLSIAVNVSARQFGEADFVEHLLNTVDEAGIDPARLKLEVTETTVHDVDDTRQKMAALRERGLVFSMDDFGVGYSSLSRLIHLPIGQLKIDRSFVRDMFDVEAARVVVDTIIGMAESLRVQVIAEGVETEAQLRALEAQGCKLFQGFLVSAAVPLARFEALVSAPSSGSATSS